MKHQFDEELWNDKGLGFCNVCMCGECELTTDCVGEPINATTRAEICRGETDYIDGEWIHPAKWKEELERAMQT